MRVLVTAPFERGLGQGGSQRATAVAERLEERGIEVGWLRVSPRLTTPAQKLRSLARAEPALVGLYAPPSKQAFRSWDAVLIAHSYLAPCVRTSAPDMPAVIDFHNLEWVHLADGRSHVRRERWAYARQMYVAAQVRLMRRLERTVIRASELSLFVSPAEHAWASRVAPQKQSLLVRSILPRDEEAGAASIHAARSPESGHLVYVGTLTFPTNLVSLERFLMRDWPTMRAAKPGLRLTVAGACDPNDRARLERHAQVQTVGFVSDLTGLLANCDAVVMPFDGVAGTSLRTLFYALAGLPVIGSDQAFRGVGFPVGTVARSPHGWAAAVRTLGGPASAVLVAEGRRRALDAQRDRGPWDRLAEGLEHVTRSAIGAQSVPYRVESRAGA